MISFLEPEKLIENLSLEEHWTAADFGSGAGGFTIPLAKKLKKGRVYALDIQEEPLSALVGNAKLFGLNNIKTIQCDLEEPKGSTLPDNSLDLVLMVNLLFQVESKTGILKEAKRVLRPGGKIIIIDWKEDAPFGPSEERITKDEVKKIARRLELKVKKEIDAGSYHWGIILEK
jgi:ubiquinone/menaquinone biosynthesis C-methylase UbiE